MAKDQALTTKKYDPNLFYDRDLSWLAFNERVLNEAMDPRNPLLERLRFYDIFRSNVDEFFMKRVSRVFQMIEEDVYRTPLAGIKWQDLYIMFLEKIKSLYALTSVSFAQTKEELNKANIQLVSWTELSPSDHDLLNEYFQLYIFPILTPLAVDSGHPFPFLSNLSKSVGICLVNPKDKEKYFARVKIPSVIEQWIPLPSKTGIIRYINIEDVISQNINSLFPGMEIAHTMLFRITRSALMKSEDDAEDVMEMVSEGIKERKFAPIVRLEYEETNDPWILNFLSEELELSHQMLMPFQSLINHANFNRIYQIDFPELKFKPFIARDCFIEHSAGHDAIFAQIRESDQLFHFPYESFSSSVEKFLNCAVHDPKVRAIKMTLYRTDADGKIIKLLEKAVKNHKQVACIIELKARFDEERNIHWAQKLEEEGVHVSYGDSYLKTHAKMMLVVRQEDSGLATYVNISTGNFNSQTSRFYTDLSFFTARKDITFDVLQIFNSLTGRALENRFQSLLVAPYNMHSHFLKMIKQETRYASKGKPARIIAKMNSLEDPEIILALYEASQAGVKCSLIIRGFCVLKAGIKGLSENIEVLSLVGRLLEHSRVYYFSNGSDDPIKGKFFIGSADWMQRNLFDRIEVIAPIAHKSLKDKIWKYLELTLSDNRNLWKMNSEGEYQQVRSDDKKIICSQEIMIGSMGEK